MPKNHPGPREVSGLIKAFGADESGATAIEYGMIVALIFLAIVTAINNFTATTNEMYDEIESTLDEATS